MPMTTEETDNWQSELIKKYPNTLKLFFRNGNGNPLDAKDPFWGCQYWGIECENGWKGIISDALGAIEDNILRLKKIGVEDDALPYVTQIKEKCGGLRIYMSGYTEIADRAIEKGEQESFTVCEICGAPGTLRENRYHYLKTLCDKCAGDEYV